MLKINISHSKKYALLVLLPVCSLRQSSCCLTCCLYVDWCCLYVACTLTDVEYPLCCMWCPDVMPVIPESTGISPFFVSLFFPMFCRHFSLNFYVLLPLFYKFLSSYLTFPCSAPTFLLSSCNLSPVPLCVNVMCVFVLSSDKWISRNTHIQQRLSSILLFIMVPFNSSITPFQHTLHNVFTFIQCICSP